MIKLEEFVRRFAANRETIVSLMASVPGGQARWRPQPGKWSLLEVINHLYDEEREDFRQRLDLTLHKPGEPWPLFDQVAWVTDRAYNEQDVADSVQRFERERDRSLQWLGGLGAVDWNLAYQHPKLGALRAGDLIKSWLVHDYLHIRQMVGLHHAYLQTQTEPFHSDYAGPW